MNRRQAIPLIAAAPLGLAGCGDPALSVTRRFRIIATVEVDGERVEGSTVMEITYRKLTSSAIGHGASTKLRGEALILDIPNRGTVYLLPTCVDNSRQIFRNMYESGLLTTLKIKGDIGMLDKDRLEVIRQARGRLPFYLASDGHPTLLPIAVTFKDERNSTTNYEVDLKHMPEHFNGVTFIGLDIEFVSEPVTAKLKERLPWLSKNAKAVHFSSRMTPIQKSYFFPYGS